jgi:glycosyltransferase involved in cell wall biosynthesis
MKILIYKAIFFVELSFVFVSFAFKKNSRNVDKHYSYIPLYYLKKLIGKPLTSREKALEKNSLISIFQPDLILFQSATPFYPLILLKKLKTKTKTIWCQNGVAKKDVKSVEMRDIINYCMSEGMLNCTHFFFQSEYCLKDFLQINNLRSEQNTIIINPIISHHYFKEIKSSKKKHIDFIVAGNIRDDICYRLTDAIKFAKSIEPLYSSKVLVYGNLWSEAKSVIANESPHAVRYCGPYNSFIDVTNLKTNPILLHFSREDACPNVILESLQYGIPIIALNSGGVPEILTNSIEFDFRKLLLPEDFFINALHNTCETAREMVVLIMNNYNSISECAQKYSTNFSDNKWYEKLISL